MHNKLRLTYDLLQQKGKWNLECLDSTLVMLAYENRRQLELNKVNKENSDGTAKKRNALLTILGKAIAKLAKALVSTAKDKWKALLGGNKKLSRTDVSDCNTIELSRKRDQECTSYQRLDFFR